MLGGLDEALPRVEFTAWPGWPSPGAPAGPSASNPAFDRVNMFLKMYVRQVSLGGRTERLWLASCLYLFGLCVGQAVVASYSVHAVHRTTVSLDRSLVASYMYT